MNKFFTIFSLLDLCYGNGTLQAVSLTTHSRLLAEIVRIVGLPFSHNSSKLIDIAFPGRGAE